MKFELDDETMKDLASQGSFLVGNPAVPTDYGHNSERMEEGFAEILGKLEDLTTKTVNLALKLEEHMGERDAHNPAIMYKNKKSSS